MVWQRQAVNLGHFIVQSLNSMSPAGRDALILSSWAGLIKVKQGSVSLKLTHNYKISQIGNVNP